MTIDSAEPPGSSRQWAPITSLVSMNASRGWTSEIYSSSDEEWLLRLEGMPAPVIRQKSYASTYYDGDTRHSTMVKGPRTHCRNKNHPKSMNIQSCGTIVPLGTSKVNLQVASQSDPHHPSLNYRPPTVEGIKPAGGATTTRVVLCF